MRQDVEKLLHKDKVFLWGARKKRLEALCALLDGNETAEIILLGQLDMYHGTISAPERMEAAICVTDRGIALYGSVWKYSASFRQTWRQLKKLDTENGLAAGVRIGLADQNTGYLFRENYRGKLSEQHKKELERMKQIYFYQKPTPDGESL
ncbi:hypothetical protein [Clostridium sp. KNHs216]|uniref:hypothetical protein n=1 Tax=Clostridium sp. KNHs216 TaxID=1550235 RepID=UPI00115499EB|nr:hypothetical protein [Clostridium sp. KNHs216]TQI68344.1 hypothetical protein LY85_3080 [Clostridium sp. KNHs216]